jgi:hypothetical protein
MINFNAYVIELEADNSYKVCIENVYKGIVTNDGLIDDSVTTFESALSTVIETMLKLVVVYLVKAVRVVSMLSRLITWIDNNKTGRLIAYRFLMFRCVVFCMCYILGVNKKQTKKD